MTVPRFCDPNRQVGVGACDRRRDIGGFFRGAAFRARPGWIGWPNQIVLQRLLTGLAQIPHQANPAQGTEDGVSDVQLPPEETLVGRTLVMMVVVVPALAQGDQRQPEVVAALIDRGIPTPAEEMAERVDGEGAVIQQDAC